MPATTHPTAAEYAAEYAAAEAAARIPTTEWFTHDGKRYCVKSWLVDCDYGLGVEVAVEFRDAQGRHVLSAREAATVATQIEWFKADMSAEQDANDDGFTRGCR